ncbi:MAG: Sarcosine oxidase beta subunit [Blastococcus sp.]|nr:Sarcosine oxidase beta subunit [Blastococcus sp.]
MKSYDLLVIGGGMAGVSIGYEMASDRSVGLLEMESTLAFHTTGRSAATFLESYGGPYIRGLTVASRAFLENPPDTFESKPLSPLPLLWLAPEGRGDLLRAMHDEVSQLVRDVRLVQPDEAYEMHPLLRRGYLELAMLEPGAMEIDVHAVHAGYVRGLRQRKGDIRTSVKIVEIGRRAGVWTLRDSQGEEYQAPVVVNAAGAWVDDLAALARVTPIGIMPLRRTIFMLGAPDGLDTSRLPLAGDIDGTFYMKPEGPQLLCSPADEVLQPPSDARPDEVEIARAVDAIQDATTLTSRHVRTSWAGLRNFTPDRVPVVGFDPAADGFFWFAGQGGYGIQTAPAMARTGASLIRGADVPEDVAARGVTAAAIAPDRPGLSILATH